jgi:hypothetical protein
LIAIFLAGFSAENFPALFAFAARTFLILGFISFPVSFQKALFPVLETPCGTGLLSFFARR